MKVGIIGASGTIGKAFVDYFLKDDEIDEIYCFSRSIIDRENDKIKHSFIDIEDEESIKNAANIIPEDIFLDILIIATGILHTENISPEKSLKDLASEKFAKLFAVNTIGPALIAKYFIPKMTNKSRSIFAALSARVGSISDNQLGGWYAYRCSKAALNMLIKNISIETARKNPYLITVGLHPGTVEGNLSTPFSAGIRKDKIFTPDYSARKMIDVLDNLTPKDSGKLLAWDGQEIGF